MSSLESCTSVTGRQHAMYVCKIKYLKPPKHFIQYLNLKTEPFYLRYNNLVSCAHASSYYVCLVIFLFSWFVSGRICSR